MADKIEGVSESVRAVDLTVPRTACAGDVVDTLRRRETSSALNQIACHPPKTITCENLLVLQVSYPLNKSNTKRVVIGLDMKNGFEPRAFIKKSGSNDGAYLTFEQFEIFLDHLSEAFAYTDHRSVRGEDVELGDGQVMKFKKYGFQPVISIFAKQYGRDVIVLANPSIEQFFKMNYLMRFSMGLRSEWGPLAKAWFADEITFLRDFQEDNNRDIHTVVELFGSRKQRRDESICFNQLVAEICTFGLDFVRRALTEKEEEIDQVNDERSLEF